MSGEKCGAKCPTRHIDEAIYPPYCQLRKGHKGSHRDGIHRW